MPRCTLKFLRKEMSHAKMHFKVFKMGTSTFHEKGIMQTSVMAALQTLLLLDRTLPFQNHGAEKGQVLSLVDSQGMHDINQLETDCGSRGLD